jgi:hypothetical protein
VLDAQDFTPRTRERFLAAAVTHYWRSVHGIANDDELAAYRVDWEDGILCRLTADPPARLFRSLDVDPTDPNADLVDDDALHIIREEVGQTWV